MVADYIFRHTSVSVIATDGSLSTYSAKNICGRELFPVSVVSEEMLFRRNCGIPTSKGYPK